MGELPQQLKKRLLLERIPGEGASDSQRPSERKDEGQELIRYQQREFCFVHRNLY